MKKYLNVIIVSFFAFLLLEYDYGLPLIIPIIFGVLSYPLLNKFINFSSTTINSFIILLSYIIVFCIIYVVSMYFCGMNEYEKGLVSKIFAKIKTWE